MKKKFNIFRNEKGASAVEFALILPTGSADIWNLSVWDRL